MTEAINLMRAITVSIAVVLSFLLVGPAISRDEAPAETVLGVELTCFHFDYKEKLELPYKSTEEGWIPGIRFTVSQNPGIERTTGRAMLTLAWGETIYDGSLQDGTPYVKRNQPQRFIDLEAHGVYRATEMGAALSISPYIGGGMRMWKRGEDELPSYVCNYTLFYVPIGVLADYAITPTVSLSGDIAIRPMVIGVVSHPMFDSSGVLSPKLGYRIATALKMRLSPKMSVQLRPWYEYSAIGGGDVSTSGRVFAYEPESKTKQYGVDAGLQIDF